MLTAINSQPQMQQLNQFYDPRSLYLTRKLFSIWVNALTNWFQNQLQSEMVTYLTTVITDVCLCLCGLHFKDPDFF